MLKWPKIFLGLILAVLLVAAGVWLSLPNVTILDTCFTTSMYQVKLCSNSQNYVRIKQVSPYMIHALIAAEDGSFYSHQGFDWHEMKASFDANLRSGHLRRGGSTLTQQLAKNAFLDKDKSLWRKLKEAYLAHAIEKNFSKDFILEKYLNVVEFGPNLYGVKAAANHYFHKAPSQLTPLDSAYLASLLPNPKIYSKTYSRGALTPFSQKMIKIILRRMVSFRKLTESEYQVSMENLNLFPWLGLGIDSFTAPPTYSLEAPSPNPEDYSPQDEPMDESTLEEIIDEDLNRENQSGQ